MEVAEKKFKYVTFSDGIMPGEGTSPSGGEELSSPPPNKLPKEKRFKKTKPPKPVKVLKKKKVKVRFLSHNLLLVNRIDKIMFFQLVSSSEIMYFY